MVAKELIESTLVLQPAHLTPPISQHVRATISVPSIICRLCSTVANAAYYYSVAQVISRAYRVALYGANKLNTLIYYESHQHAATYLDVS